VAGRVACPFGLGLCITLTHGCPTLVARFWRQGGYDLHSESRVPDRRGTTGWEESVSTTPYATARLVRTCKRTPSCRCR